MGTYLNPGNSEFEEMRYLAYDGEEGTARIPNEESRIEFVKSIREVKSIEQFRMVTDHSHKDWEGKLLWKSY